MQILYLEKVFPEYQQTKYLQGYAMFESQTFHLLIMARTVFDNTISMKFTLVLLEF